MSFIPQFEWFFYRSTHKKNKNKRKRALTLQRPPKRRRVSRRQIERIQNKSESKEESSWEKMETEDRQEMGWLLMKPHDLSEDDESVYLRAVEFSFSIVRQAFSTVDGVKALINLQRKTCSFRCSVNVNFIRCCGDKILSNDTGTCTHMCLCFP